MRERRVARVSGRCGGRRAGRQAGLTGILSGSGLGMSPRLPDWARHSAETAGEEASGGTDCGGGVRDSLVRLALH